MTGPRERPSTQPREKRTANTRERASLHRSTYRQDRAAVLMLFAAKIAAAQLYAPKYELSAILAALRAEERATLQALRDQERMRAAARRVKRLGWNFASRAAGRRKKARDPNRPAVRTGYRGMRPRIR